MCHALCPATGSLARSLLARSRGGTSADGRRRDEAPTCESGTAPGCSPLRCGRPCPAPAQPCGEAPGASGRRPPPAVSGAHGCHGRPGCAEAPRALGGPAFLRGARPSQPGAGSFPRGARSAPGPEGSGGIPGSPWEPGLALRSFPSSAQRPVPWPGRCARCCLARSGTDLGTLRALWPLPGLRSQKWLELSLR